MDVFITRQGFQAFITEKKNMIIIIHLPSTDSWMSCFFIYSTVIGSGNILTSMLYNLFRSK